MSSALIKAISWLAGTRCCRVSKGKRSKIFVTAGLRYWAVTSTSAIGADIASSYITRALWGVISYGECSGKRACCTRPHAPSSLH